MKFVLLFVFLVGAIQSSTFVSAQMILSARRVNCSAPSLGHYREVTGKIYDFEYKDDVLDGGTGELDKTDPHFRINLRSSQIQRDVSQRNYCQERLELKGEIIDNEGKVYRFNEAFLSRDSRKLKFITEEIEKSKYEFEGRFYEKPELENGIYIKLAGKLKIYKESNLAAEKEVKFLSWGLQ